MRLDADLVIQGVDYICDGVQDEKIKLRCKASLYAVACVVYGLASLNLIANIPKSCSSNYSINPFHIKLSEEHADNHPAYIPYFLAILGMAYKTSQYMQLSLIFYGKSISRPAPLHRQTQIIQHAANG